MCTSVTCQWLHTDTLLSPSRGGTWAGWLSPVKDIDCCLLKNFSREGVPHPFPCIKGILPFWCTKAVMWTRVTPALCAGTMELADRRTSGGLWAWGDQAGLWKHPTLASVQHNVLPGANPYLHCPPRARVMAAVQAVPNQAPGAAGRHGHGAANTHRGACPVIASIWCTPDPSPCTQWLVRPAPGAAGWVGSRQAGKVHLLLQACSVRDNTQPSRNCSCPAAAEGETVSSRISPCPLRGLRHHVRAPGSCWPLFC